MRLAIVPVILTIVVFTTSCDTDSGVDKLQQQVRNLNKDVKALQALKTDVENLQRDSSASQFERDIERVAYLTPGSSGYSTIKTNIGSLVVSLADIKPYANGSRVALRFGNLTSATLDDVSVTLDFGAVDEKGTPLNNNAKSKDVTFIKPFRPGSWNTVDAILDGVPPANLGFIRVRNVSNKAVHLFR